MTEFSGTLLVTRDGDPVVRKSAGPAQGASGEPCSAGTLFQVASVSKQFLAAAVMLLVDDGAVDLDGQIGRLLPGCAPVWRELTLHQLLSHTSGLGQWNELPDFDVTRPGAPEEILERMGRLPLRSTAGDWHYSSPGYLLAARVVEAVSGAAYADLLTERILGPLALVETHVGPRPPASAAWGHSGGRRVDVAEFLAVPGTGDVTSTVGDLTRWTEAFEAGELLSEASRRTLVSPQAELGSSPDPEDPAPASAYGYGYFLGTVCGFRARFHPGDNPGYRSFLAHLPDLRVTIAILCNDEQSDLDDLLRGLTPELDALALG